MFVLIKWQSIYCDLFLETTWNTSKCIFSSQAQRLIMRLNVAPESSSVEYIPISVVSALITQCLNRIICVCAYIIMHALCTCLHSASCSGTLAHSCLCLSDSLSILFLLPGFLKKSQRFLTISEPKNAALSEGWGRRSYQAFPGAVSVTPSPCSAAPTPRTKQPYWWW